MHSSPTNPGALASAAWCAERALFPKDPNWSVEIALHADEWRFTIEIYAQEWGFAVRHLERTSWIRVTDVAFVHGSDDFQLLRNTPHLGSIGELIASIEIDQRIVFGRANAIVQSSFGGEDVIRAWVRSLGR